MMLKPVINKLINFDFDDANKVNDYAKERGLSFTKALSEIIREYFK